MTDILELLAAADPAHRDTPIHQLLPMESRPERTTDMTTTSSRTDDRRGTVRRSPLPAVAAAVAVVVAIGAIALVTSDSRPTAADLPAVAPVVDPDPLEGASAVEVLEAYIDRLDAGDLDGALSLFEAEFRSRVQPDGYAPGPAAAAWALYFIAGGGSLDATCSEGTEPGIVLCTVEATDDVLEAFGLDPAVHEWSAQAEGGLIVDASRLHATLGRSGGAEDVETPYGAALAAFDAWARDTHFDAFLEACRGTAPAINLQSWTPACADFRLGVVDEYVATLP